MINIITGKEAIYEVDNYDVVLVGTSTHCMLNGTFQGKMANKYPKIVKVNNSTGYGDLRKLGKRITIDDIKPIISLMYICTYPTKKSYVDYNALERCLKTANAEFSGKKIITTVLGASPFDGKGDKEKILDIMKKTLTDVDVDVYDYEMMTIREETNRQHDYFAEQRAACKGIKKDLAEVKKLEIEMRYKTYLVNEEEVKKLLKSIKYFSK